MNSGTTLGPDITATWIQGTYRIITVMDTYTWTLSLGKDGERLAAKAGSVPLTLPLIEGEDKEHD